MMCLRHLKIRLIHLLFKLADRMRSMQTELLGTAFSMAQMEVIYKLRRTRCYFGELCSIWIIFGTYGIYTCGMYTYGIYTYGMYTYGMYSYDIYTYGMYTYGV